jgi:bis(5'-adenosyl)-triphosphatase
MPVQQQRRPELYGRVGISMSESIKLPGEEFVFNFGPAKVPGLAIFYRTALTVAFTNKKPVVLGHFLVCPVRKVEKLSDLSEEELTDLFKVVQKVEVFSQKFYKVDSSTVSIQNGPLAGQSIPHVHVHILPRREGDFAENDDIYKELQDHDKKQTGWRTEEEMVAEAKVLREAWGKVI